jgi:hypothetical protein
VCCLKDKENIDIMQKRPVLNQTKGAPVGIAVRQLSFARLPEARCSTAGGWFSCGANSFYVLVDSFSPPFFFSLLLAGGGKKRKGERVGVLDP